MKIPTEINNFHGEWGVLSNFYDAIVRLWVDPTGQVFAYEVPDAKIETYRCVENAFQAAKSLNAEARRTLTLDFNPNLTAGRAKRIGRGFRQRGLERGDWEQVKIEFMRGLLIQKFIYSILRRRLLSTFTANLVEGNWWHDITWGVCYGGLPEGFDGRHCREGIHEPVGDNWLGRLLMETRNNSIVQPTQSLTQPSFRVPAVLPASPSKEPSLQEEQQRSLDHPLL
jgi:ribA/ribD-fused uncharacterized protein